MNPESPSGLALQERMARAIAAAVFSSQGDLEDDPKRPVMAARRRVAEEAAIAALQAIQPGDDLGGGLVAMPRSSIDR
ncbi:hypothetical protein [Consotaella salsifontis]|uniref:Uncharacterized protein n=1 Tax=Consotaella salsifontis TaxID=1365950 RepID=A0A1T4SEX0_9HYPH|nr:hypothetical protein [Consotaella salsifontis]SKA26723.1 hypothetical protein SAMN05428963_110115 [Consotaella salsifontis]